MKLVASKKQLIDRWREHALACNERYLRPKSLKDNKRARLIARGQAEAFQLCIADFEIWIESLKIKKKSKK